MAVKKTRKNMPALWDKFWSDPGLFKDDKILLASEKATSSWQRIEEVLLKELGSFKGLKVIEIGSGVGTYAALMAKKGAFPTVLDYSQKALDRAKEFFPGNNLSVTTILADALVVPKNLLGSYDICVSSGLTEHFRGKKRFSINKVHLDLVKNGGCAVIVVPNKYNPPYGIYKWISEILGSWRYGEEYPYSRSELLSICKNHKAKLIGIYGSGLYSSLKFLLPANFLRRPFGLAQPRALIEIRKERKTLLDDYLGHTLSLVMKKV